MKITPTDKKILIHLYEAEKRRTMITPNAKAEGMKERTQRAISQAIDTEVNRIGRHLTKMLSNGLVTRSKPSVKHWRYKPVFIYSLTEEGRRQALESIKEGKQC